MSAHGDTVGVVTYTEDWGALIVGKIAIIELIGSKVQFFLLYFIKKNIQSLEMAQKSNLYIKGIYSKKVYL